MKSILGGERWMADTIDEACEVFEECDYCDSRRRPQSGSFISPIQVSTTLNSSIGGDHSSRSV